MPFTLVHPAAVVPISRALRHRVSLSALLAGSVVPDFRHFPQIPSFGIASHSLPGMFTFCLPLGLFFYVSFHGIFKPSLIALLPDGWRSRVETLEASHRRWPRSSIAVVILSLLAGTATHLIWDSFTHAEPVAEHVALLRHRLNGMPVFAILQYVCSLLGMGLLAVWLARWFRETAPGPARAGLSSTGRALAIGVILLGSTAIGLVVGTALAHGGEPLRKVLIGAAFGTFCGLWLTLLAFSAWWYRFAPVRAARP